MTSWRGHEVILQLVELVREANPGLQVFDGQPKSRNQHVDNEVVLIGADPLSQAAAISARAEPDLCGHKEETGEVALFIAVVRGDQDPVATRARVAEILDNIETALDNDFHLGGVISEAWVGDSIALTQGQDENGAKAQISTTIFYRAL